MSNNNWVKICKESDLKKNELFEYDYQTKKLLIVKTQKNIYAVDRICTHAYADLSLGILNEEEKTVTCPLHLSAFSLEDGVPQNLPAEEPLNKYEVKVQDGWVYLLI